MKTLILKEPFNWQYGEAAVPNQPADNHTIVKIHSIGICGTDYHAYRGKQPFFSYPRILGHELGVEVIGIGKNVTNIKIGDKCAVEPYLNCGHCHACQIGKPNCCESLNVIGVHSDGGMVEYLEIPAHKLHASSQLSYEQLALVETLAIGCHAVDRAQLTTKDTALIIGAGPIGLTVLTFAKLNGIKCVVADMNEKRLQFCKDKLGADEVILLKDSPLENTCNATAIFDATGNETSMNHTFTIASHGSKIVFVGLFQGNVSFHDPNFHRRELTVMSSRNALSSDFKKIISWIENGKIDTNTWITHRIAFDQIASEFEHLLKPESGVLKAIIKL